MGKLSVHIDPIVVSPQSVNFYNDLLTIQHVNQIKKKQRCIFKKNSKQENVTHIPEYSNKKLRRGKDLDVKDKNSINEKKN